MERRRRTAVEILGTREARAIAGSLGHELRLALKRRHLTHAQMGERVGISRPRISELVRGDGASAPLGVWVRLGLAIDRPLAVSFSRSLDVHEQRDAGHLAAQELVLRMVRQTGRRADFESPSRPTDPSRSIDIAIRDDRSQAIVIVEIWNRLDDLGAAARASSRKVSEAESHSTATACDDHPYRIALCWLLVDTSANRRLVGRYPEIMRSRFPGSSVAWVGCIVGRTPPPDEPGCAWIDPRSGRGSCQCACDGPAERRLTQTHRPGSGPRAIHQIVRPGAASNRSIGSPNRAGGATTTSAGPPHGAPMAVAYKASQMITRVPASCATGPLPASTVTDAPARIRG